jgi:hypothetical protein
VKLEAGHVYTQTGRHSWRWLILGRNNRGEWCCVTLDEQNIPQYEWDLQVDSFDHYVDLPWEHLYAMDKRRFDDLLESVRDRMGV